MAELNLNLFGIPPVDPTPDPDKYDPVSNGDLAKWWTLSQQLAALKEEEMALRKKIGEMFFPDADEEATTTKKLADGSQVKLTTSLNRKIDEPALRAAAQSLINESGIPLDNLVKWKPDLVISEYRKLTDDQRIMFDQYLTVTPGSPTLKIVPPKAAKEIF